MKNPPQYGGLPLTQKHLKSFTFSNGYINRLHKKGFQTIAFNGRSAFFRNGSKNGADAKVKRRLMWQELNESLPCLKKFSFIIYNIFCEILFLDEVSGTCQLRFNIGRVAIIMDITSSGYTHIQFHTGK